MTARHGSPWQYGITRTDLPEPTEKPKTVVFCDIGHSDFSVRRQPVWPH